jgi:hypothetical protein
MPSLTQTGHNFCTFFMRPIPWRQGSRPLGHRRLGGHIPGTSVVESHRASTPTVTVEYTHRLCSCMPVIVPHYDPPTVLGTISLICSEHQQRITMFNPDTFSVGHWPPSLLGTHVWYCRRMWTDGGGGHLVDYCCILWCWVDSRNEAPISNTTHSYLDILPPQMPTDTLLVGGVKGYWSPEATWPGTHTQRDDTCRQLCLGQTLGLSSPCASVLRIHPTIASVDTWPDTFATGTGIHDYISFVPFI